MGRQGWSARSILHLIHLEQLVALQVLFSCRGDIRVNEPHDKTAATRHGRDRQEEGPEAAIGEVRHDKMLIVDGVGAWFNNKSGGVYP